MFGSIRRLWRQQARDRRFLAPRGDRDLADVGLTRGDIWREQSQPFRRTGSRPGSLVCRAEPFGRSGQDDHSIPARQPGASRGAGVVQNGRLSSWQAHAQ
jgi:uncharacterized protein YjiS (DUF1127 family)